MVRFLLLFIPIFIVALDFEFVIEKIYKLEPDEYSIENGRLSVNLDFDKIHTQLNKSIKTQSSKLVIDKSLKYYYHTNKFIDFKDDLIELKLIDNRYTANIANRSLKNCFIVVKNAELKTLKTKSNAMLLDLNKLDSSNDCKIYFKCMNNRNYY